MEPWAFLKRSLQQEEQQDEQQYEISSWSKSNKMAQKLANILCPAYVRMRYIQKIFRENVGELFNIHESIFSNKKTAIWNKIYIQATYSRD